MKFSHLMILIMSINLLNSCASTQSIFKKEVAQRFTEAPQVTRIITQKDIDLLPKPVANYLENCAWLGKEWNFAPLLWRSCLALS